MAYEKHTWVNGEIITASKMNNIENGIETVDTNQANFIQMVEEGETPSSQQPGIQIENSTQSVLIPTMTDFDGLETRVDNLENAIDEVPTEQDINEIKNITAPTESTSTAAAAHAKGSYLIYDGKLYQVTADIAIGDTLATTGTGANIAQVTGGAMGEVADLKSNFDGTGFVMSNASLTDAHDAIPGIVYYLNQSRIDNCSNLPQNARPGFLVSLGFTKELPHNYLLIYMPYTTTNKEVYMKGRQSASSWYEWKRVDAGLLTDTVNATCRIANTSESNELTNADNAKTGIIYVKPYTITNAPTGIAAGDIILWTMGGSRDSSLCMMCYSNTEEKAYIRYKQANNLWGEWAELGGSSINIVQETGNSLTDVMSQKAVTDAISGGEVIGSVRASINLLPEDGILEKTQLNPTTGATSYHASYKTSDYIPCKPLTDYRYSVFDANGNAAAGFVGVFCYYDENKGNLTGTGHTNVGAQTVWTTPANAAYFRIQAFDTGAAWMITEGTFFKAAPGSSGSQQRDIESIEFVPYNNHAVAVAGEPQNPLIGKYLIDFGDSIERGDGTNGKGIGYLVAKYNQMAFTQFSVGGMTIADTNALYKTYDRNYISGKSYYTSSGTLLVPDTDYNVGERITTSSVYQRNVLSAYLDSAENANIEPDYIIIEGGTNDISSNVTLGDTISGYTGPFDTTTFAGALEDGFRRIRTKWANVKIIFVRVHNMNSRNAEKQVTFGEMAKKVCNKWSIKFVDMYSECGLNTNIANMKTLYTSNADGTHPNADGYKYFYQEPVINALRSR